MEQTILAIAIILFTSKVGGLISQKLKMPEVLGVLVVGIIIGPVVLDVVHFDEHIETLSTLGVIMLMFLAGLETNLDELKKAGKTSLVIATLGVLLPLVVGTFVMDLFTHNLYQSIFIGLILTATSVTITVQTLNELGKLNTRVGMNILGAAVIDDILGFILIAILISIHGGTGEDAEGSTSIIKVLINVLIFCGGSVLAVLFLPKIIDKFVSPVPKKAMLTIVYSLVLAVAFLSEQLGIAAITGAYIFGLMLSKTSKKECLLENTEVISIGLLSPVFFASVGLKTSIHGITPDIITITLVLLLIAVLTKVVGCGIGAKIFKMSNRESMQIGIGMVPRGEVALVTANIGLQTGLLPNTMFPPIVIVIILTTIIAPIFLKLTYPHQDRLPHREIEST